MANNARFVRNIASNGTLLNQIFNRFVDPWQVRQTAAAFMKTAVPEHAGELSELESDKPSRGNVQGRRADSSDLDPTGPGQVGFADAGGLLDDVLRSRVYETLPDAILVTLDGQVAYANAAAKRLFGDDTGNGFAELATIGLLHPASRSVVANRIEETLRTGDQARSLRGSALRFDGKVFDFDAAMSRLQWGGGEACLVSLRESVQSPLGDRINWATGTQLADAMNQAGEGFALFDAEDRLAMFNDVFKNTLPEIADHVVVGACFEDIMRAALDAGTIRHDYPSDDEWLAMRLSRHRNPTTSYIGETADGRSLRITECRTADGGIVSIRSDVTQLKKIELDLKSRVAEFEDAKSVQDVQSRQLGDLAVRLSEAKDIADAASRTKSEFLANMSHELRTPLNAIMGFSEVIQNQMFGLVGVPQYVDYAADIYASGAHLLEIINDILDLSKVEAGKLEVSEERLDLRAVADAVFQLVKGRADEGGVTLMHDIAHDLPQLYADKRKLKQMLLNLLSNAIKFTHQGGTVDLVARVADDGGLSLCIRDTGIGIAADQFDLVLAPFGQVDSALAREHQGTGLGLPLVKALVELHGGHMTLDSAPDVGTNISLCFPPERTRN